TIIPVGAFVEIAPGKDGFVHISQLTHERLERVEDAVSVGDEVEVVVTEIRADGKINLSRRALLPQPEGGVPQGDRGGQRQGFQGDRGGDRGRPQGGDRGGNRREGGRRPGFIDDRNRGERRGSDS